jgi:hypothetical protein
MALHWKNERQKTESRREAVVRFVGEQTGGPAHELKSALGPILSARSGVAEAYLARVVFGVDAVFKVTLCVHGPDDAELVREVDACFHQLFENDAHLELLFLSEAQRAELRGVCPPFFVRTGAATA